MKKLTSFFALVVLISAILSVPARASAQSVGVQKALETAKETIDSLVTAKDDKQPQELSLRIQTLIRAFDLSLAEAKDAETKLDALDNLTTLEDAWRSSKMEDLDSAIQYFQTQKDSITANSNDLTAEEVKNTAEDFKTWRNENYLPVISEVRDYFLVDQQEKTIETAKTRWQKIDEDVKKLEKAKVKNIASARRLLKTANTLILDSDEINQNAHTLFFATFIDDSSSTATSSKVSVKKSVTGSESKISADVAKSDEPTPPSIRDLVKDSSMKIKDAYKIFIDMSSLVRRLLK